MGLIAKETGNGTFDPIPEGMFQAVCVGLYDLGTQYSERWNKRAHRVMLTWEIPEHRIQLEKDGERLDLPRNISKEYTLSLHAKSQLRKDLQSWRGKSFTSEELAGFDLQRILGVNGLIQIIHTQKDDKVYANVNNIVPLPKAMPRVEPEAGKKYFAFGDSVEIPEGTPPWILEKIQESEEWATIGKVIAKPEVDPDMPDFMKESEAAPSEEVPF